MTARPTPPFAEQLRHLRERASLSQEQLAHASGLPIRSIGDLERGARLQPDLHTLHSLASALSLSAEERQLLLDIHRRQADTQASGPLPRPVSRRARLAPQPTRPLIGRDAERKELQRYLLRPDVRLVTLVGPGGIGKTTLATDVAAGLAHEQAAFPDGVAIAYLAAASIDDMPLMVAEALDMQLSGMRPVWEQILDALRDQRLLLVLDNLEHLLALSGDALAAAIERMAAEAPGVRLLTTSRERLRLNAEWVMELGGLELPPASAGPRAERSEAVRLFVERARQAAPSFALDAESRAAVVRICRQLEGMPLAIELAASWARALAPAEIAVEVERALDFLTANNRDAPARHQGMRAALDHSWSLLNTYERAALARLSVFRGGFEREAAAAIADAPLPTLLALIEKSLVRREQVDGVTRYGLHELVRQYAAERLAVDPATQAATGARHRSFYAALLQRSIDAQTGAFTPEERATLDRNIDNLRAAWFQAAAAHDLEALATMARGLRVFYDSHGWLQDGAALYGVAADALREAGPEATAMRGLALGLQGFFLVRTGRLARARQLLDEGLRLQEATGSTEGLIELRYTFGIIEIRLGRYDEARGSFTFIAEATLARSDLARHWWAIHYLGRIALAEGRHAEAVRHYQVAYDTWHAQRYARGEAICLAFLGEIARSQGQAERAATLLRESLRVASTVRDPLVMGISLTYLGILALHNADLEEAHYLLTEAATIMRDMGDTWLLGIVLGALGQAALARGDGRTTLLAYREILQLVRAGEAGLTGELVYGLAMLLERTGSAGEALALLTAAQELPAEHDTRERGAALIRELERREIRPAPADDGSRPLLVWLEELCQRSYPQQLAAAAAAPATPAPPTLAPASGAVLIPETGESLSPREVDVLRLLIAGASNQEIADTLVISLHTAKHHVANILQKLGVATRTQAALRGRALGIEPRSSER
jgi:predicted ATPase/DNA-binding CsgD family transcriptional regulator/DNA-binding XRE family transcriptional regulator